MAGCVLAFAPLAQAQNEPPRTLRARHVNPHAPVIDGHLNDPIWQTAEFSGGFVQKEPNEGEPAANQSAIAIVYDEDAIYIAARLSSVDPDNIVSLDTYNDNRRPSAYKRE